ncbi:McrB family protein [Solibacillus ferritrahens]|uniref:McrB family protein n=1 Tax=Solibacillus ferritrahens TaxID=3098620 RepID=UPI00300BC011
MELNIYLVGALADARKLKDLNPNLSPVKPSAQFNQFQFFIDILNIDDIPTEYQKLFINRFVAGYENNIKNAEWETLSESQSYFKDNLFEEFAKDKLFIFKPYIDENNYGDKNIKISKNTLKIIKRPKNISSTAIGSLITIPIFNDYNQFSFEKRLLESSAIGNYDYLDKITSSCLVSGDYLYGDFNDFEKLNDGWHVTAENQIKKIPLDFEAYKDSMIIEAHAIYVDFEFFDDVILHEGLAKHGQVVTLDNKIKLKEVQENLVEETAELYSENDFLESLFNYLKYKNLIFEKKHVVNFHTALKTRRLVILSGASGTGKSQLVYNYAQSLGLVNKDANQFKMIPVKPNWKDDSDLIGFLDTINNIYRPSESGLVDTLIEAKNNRDKLYIVCFDEMNLAKVEHYFSQFLSVLELEGVERKISLYSKKLVGRVLNGEQYPHELPIASNVLFVGTINIDETTQTLSDKVLDRSNLIEFNIPKDHINNWITMLNENQIEQVTKENKNDKKIVDVYHFDNWSNYKKEIKLLKEEIEILSKINNLLIKIDISKGIGFRILDHINSYMSNLPLISDLKREEAFDLQIAQKIVPKIRGTIEELETIIESKESILEIFEEQRFVITIAAIKRKMKELKLYGYTY